VVSSNSTLIGIELGQTQKKAVAAVKWSLPVWV
jgi:hypothetical protein